MWRSVLQRLLTLARQVPRSPDSRFNHFAAIVHRRGQILTTGFNTWNEHAEAAVIRRHLQRQPYTQRHKPSRRSLKGAP